MDDLVKKHELKNNILSKITLIENVISLLNKLKDDENFKFVRPLKKHQIEELDKESNLIARQFMYNSMFSINTKYFYEDINSIGINRFFTKFLKFLKVYVVYKVSNRFCINDKYVEIGKLLSDFRKLNTVHNIRVNFDICHRCNVTMKLDLINDSYECPKCGYHTKKISEYDKVKYFLEVNQIIDDNNKNIIKYIKNELTIIYGQDRKDIPSELIRVISENITKNKIVLENFNIGYKLRMIMNNIKDDPRIKGKYNLTEYKKYTSSIYKRLYPNKIIPTLNYKEEQYCLNFLLEFTKIYAEENTTTKYNICYDYIIACFINNRLPNPRRNEELLKFIYIQKEDSLRDKDAKSKRIYKKMGFDFKHTKVNYYNR